VEEFQFKRIEFSGQSFELAGLPSDPYFVNLDAAHLANQSLCDVIWNQIEPNSVIFDVGANIGLTSVLFSRVPENSKVYSFEPGPQAYSCLLQTMQRNKLPVLNAYNFGLSDKAGKLSFFEADMLAGSYAITDAHPHGGLANTTINVVSIDDFVNEHNIQRLDLIKIDVEGFEAEVIKGAAKTLAALKPRVFVELNSYTLIATRNVNPRDFLAMLRSTFGNVSWRKSGEWKNIRTGADEHDFIYDNLVTNHLVSDLLCTP
jgi:FkbM family methyltransferase